MDRFPGRAQWTIVLLAVAAIEAFAQTPSRRDAGGEPAPTAALERGRTVFVLNACHFCHGTDLTRATMGAADLMRSPLVGADEDGSIIGPIVKAGLPNLQTAMPSYADLSAAELVDLARYVHFLRQQGRYGQLAREVDPGAGDAAAGMTFFTGAGGCARCHSASGDLAGATRTHDAAGLVSRVLRPGPAMPAEGAVVTPGHAAHLKLLENYTKENVQDVVAYLRQRR